jgi:hypothetical protein
MGQPVEYLGHHIAYKGPLTLKSAPTLSWPRT